MAHHSHIHSQRTFPVFICCPKHLCRFTKQLHKNIMFYGKANNLFAKCTKVVMASSEVMEKKKEKEICGFHFLIFED